MPPTYLFFDQNPEVVEALQHILLPTFQKYKDDYDDDLPRLEFEHSGLHDLIQNHQVTHFVSPCTSYGDFQVGEINRRYHILFPTLEEQTQERIEKLSSTRSPLSGRKILTIGSAITITPHHQLDLNKLQKVVLAPIMEIQHSMKFKKNVFYAMFAILQVCKDLPDNAVVAIPGLGTGDIAKMEPKDSAKQITEAIELFLNYQSPDYPQVYLKFQIRDHFLVQPSFCF